MRMELWWYHSYLPLYLNNHLGSKCMMGLTAFICLKLIWFPLSVLTLFSVKWSYHIKFIFWYNAYWFYRFKKSDTLKLNFLQNLLNLCMLNNCVPRFLTLLRRFRTSFRILTLKLKTFFRVFIWCLNRFTHICLANLFKGASHERK